MNNRIHACLLTIVLVLLVALPLSAQNRAVSGHVYDKNTGEPLAGTRISYTIGERPLNQVTAYDGSFSFTIPKGKNLQLKFSFVGYKAQSKLVNGNSDTRGLKIYMIPSETELDEVVIKRHATIMLQRKDTVVYKAENIQTNPDATALDMIYRLPGVTYKDNKLEAQGRTVSEIRVDGKEFYKFDIGMALKNLPKDVIDEVKLFEELSDYAKLAGIDDGSGTMIIDVTTKKGTGATTFGKSHAAGGTDSRYSLYGVYNRFGKKDRISLFAQFNNINEQNFSTIDLLGVTGNIANNDPTQSPFSRNAISNSFSHAENNDISTMMTEISPDGVTRTSAAGVNYSGESADWKMKYSGHYLFNLGDNTTTYDIYDQYFGETTSNNRQHQVLGNENVNHRVNFKYEYQMTPNDYLMVRPSLVFQKRNQRSELTDWTVEKDSAALDEITDFYEGMQMQDSLLLEQLSLTRQTAISTSDEVMFMHRFDSKGHALSADVKFSYTDTDENLDLTLENVQSNEYVLQNTHSLNTQKSFTATVSYIRPLTNYSKLKVDAGWNRSYAHLKQATETNVNHAEAFSIDSMLCGRANTYNGGLLANASYMYDHKRWNIVTGAEYHNYKLWTENDREIISHKYNKFLPYLYLRYLHGSIRWNLQYKTNQLFPTVFQLQEAINNTNAILSVKGNNRLEASYHHNISSRFIYTNRERASHFVCFANFETADNYIGSRRSLSSTSWVDDARHRNSEMFSYVNIPGYEYWSAKGLLAYGFPVYAIKSNVNISTMLDYANIPGYWDKDLLLNKQMNWNGFLTIGSNISQTIDFVIDTNLKYAQSTNMAFEKQNISYWSLSYGAQLKWMVVENLPFMVECGRTNYFGSGTSKFNAVICNASLGYKFLSKKNAEVQFLCHDIFNQDNNFVRTTTELYRREMTTSLLKRYFMLKFTYTFNSVKKDK